MDTLNLTEIRRRLAEKNKNHRYEHILGVEYTAAALAMAHDANVFQARLGGLLHDCAKHYKKDKIFSLCERYDLTVSEVEYQVPDLLHAKLGACIAKEKYHVNDVQILSAIRYHTTGKPEMSILEQIVFIADYIEPNRHEAAHLDIIRPLSFRSLNACCAKILADTVEYLSHYGVTMDETTVRAYEYYKPYLHD